MSWRVSRDGKVRGPFTEPEVFELIGRGKIGRGDLVSFSEGQWFSIEEAPVFGASLPNMAQVMPYVPPPISYQFAQVPFAPAPWTCPKCSGQMGSYLATKVTTAGWVMFAIGFFTCILFPLMFVGLSTKENVMFCRACRCRV